VNQSSDFHIPFRPLCIPLAEPTRAISAAIMSHFFRQTLIAPPYILPGNCLSVRVWIEVQEMNAREINDYGNYTNK
jgi:hypothetical protein